MDVSSLPEEAALGARFYDEGKEGDALEILKKYGANSLRIRLWNDPYSEDGKPYSAGTSDFTKLVALASAGKKLGYSYLLDLHYSDFWADPGKQFPPKEWAYAGADALEKHVYDYTKDVLLKLKRLDLLPEMVQVGNEITNGLMWPHGKWDNVDNIARFISAGIRAVREVSPDSRVMLHLDCGGNNARCREWFDAYVQRGEDFDVIGLSYYPFWHGTIDDLTNNMNDLSQRYQKDVIVAEVSMGFTMEDYADREKLAPKERKGMATKPNLAEAVSYDTGRTGCIHAEGHGTHCAGSGWQRKRLLLLGAGMDPGARLWLGQRGVPEVYSGSRSRGKRMGQSGTVRL